MYYQPNIKKSILTSSRVWGPSSHVRLVGGSVWWYGSRQ